MRNIKLIAAYDGTDFSGWQLQKNARTVQGELESALCKLHKHPVRVAGAGRTDRGVHARGQAAHFFTDIQSIKPEQFIPALNSLLPADVRVMSAVEVPETFHARFDAKARCYRYEIIAGRAAFPHEQRYALHLRRIPNIAALNGFARLLRGEMDCSLFASAVDKGCSTFRYINGARFFMDGRTLCFEISANAFLWKMVRSIVGSLLFYEEQRLPEPVFLDYLKRGDRRLAGPTAPPHGLTLWRVDY